MKNPLMEQYFSQMEKEFFNGPLQKFRPILPEIKKHFMKYYSDEHVVFKIEEFDKEVLDYFIKAAERYEQEGKRWEGYEFPYSSREFAEVINGVNEKFKIEDTFLQAMENEEYQKADTILKTISILRNYNPDTPIDEGNINVFAWEMDLAVKTGDVDKTLSLFHKLKYNNKHTVVRDSLDEKKSLTEICGELIKTAYNPKIWIQIKASSDEVINASKIRVEFASIVADTLAERIIRANVNSKEQFNFCLEEAVVVGNQKIVSKYKDVKDVGLEYPVKR